MVKKSKHEDFLTDQPRAAKPGVFRNIREAHIAALEAKQNRSEREEWILKQLKERSK